MRDARNIAAPGWSFMHKCRSFQPIRTRWKYHAMKQAFGKSFICDLNPMVANHVNLIRNQGLPQDFRPGFNPTTLHDPSNCDAAHV